MDIERITLPAQHYLYVDREASFEGNEMAEVMGSGFGEVFGFLQANGIAPLAQPMTVYLEMPSLNGVKMRIGVFVSAEDAARASGTVKAGEIAAGDAYKALHVGPYSGMGAAHQQVWQRLEADGAAPGMPVWEIYVDDPERVSEAELRTEVFRAVA